MDPLIQSLLAFTLTSIAIEPTPGPNMAYLAILAANKGWRPGFAAVGGVALGLAILGGLAASGAAALVSASPVLWNILRWGGVAYLVWLGVDTWREAQLPLEEVEAHKSGWRFFQRGLITNLLNPKAALFYITVLPSFTAEGGKPNPGEFLLLTAIYVSVATLIHSGIVAGSGYFAPAFQREGWRKKAGFTFMLLLFGVAIWLFFKTAR